MGFTVIVTAEAVENGSDHSQLSDFTRVPPPGKGMSGRIKKPAPKRGFEVVDRYRQKVRRKPNSYERG